ncbi:hypothetical protein BDZ89DRAFT_1144444 [Hymenopellis radicata]|nr:hypothetical protein BDZ89DRAFT_1144444 [Hymenopellis radicata]
MVSRPLSQTTQSPLLFSRVSSPCVGTAFSWGIGATWTTYPIAIHSPDSSFTPGYELICLDVSSIHVWSLRCAGSTTEVDGICSRCRALGPAVDVVRNRAQEKPGKKSVIERAQAHGRLRHHVFIHSDKQRAKSRVAFQTLTVTRQLREAAMSKTVELSQITTEPQSSTVEHFNFIAKDELGLDGLEYHLGLSRGDIVRYRNLPIMSTSLRADMVELMKTSSWALLPSTDILHKIQDLYEYNHGLSTSTDERKLFTDVLPEDVYEYELMPVCTPDRLPGKWAGDCLDFGLGLGVV